jgi:hypothetical protein
MAEDAFDADGGFPMGSSPLPALPYQPPPRRPTDTEIAAQRERNRVLDEFQITREGLQFRCQGLLYSSLDGAVCHAWQTRSQP